MARTTPGVTRARILDEATRLFAAQSYESTSIADIQVACGLSAGSGALYKHFPSKQELLRAVMARHVERMTADREEYEEQVPSDLADALRFGATAVWKSMSLNQDAIRVTVRDLTPYPDLIDLMWEGVLGNVYREFSETLAAGNAAGVVEVVDTEATAAVLAASLTYFPILKNLIGRTPGDIADERFLDAWVNLAVNALSPGSDAMPGMST